MGIRVRRGCRYSLSGLALFNFHTISYPFPLFIFSIVYLILLMLPLFRFDFLFESFFFPHPWGKKEAIHRWDSFWFWTDLYKSFLAVFLSCPFDLCFILFPLLQVPILFLSCFHDWRCGGMRRSSSSSESVSQDATPSHALCEDLYYSRESVYGYVSVEVSRCSFSSPKVLKNDDVGASYWVLHPLCCCSYLLWFTFCAASCFRILGVSIDGVNLDLAPLENGKEFEQEVDQERRSCLVVYKACPDFVLWYLACLFLFVCLKILVVFVRLHLDSHVLAFSSIFRQFAFLCLFINNIMGNIL